MILLAVMLVLALSLCHGFQSRSFQSLNRKVALSRIYSSKSSSEGYDLNYDNVILYDGVCNFCNTGVDIILKIDFQRKFRYAALQSENGMKLLEKIGKEKDDISSVVLVKQVKGKQGQEYKGYFKSSCVTEVLKELNLPALSPAAVLVSSLLPMPLKDSAYETVARNRYNFLGKRNTIDRLNNLNADRFLN
jgi:predicted DCC family thiol-disulfide oxidoreductase YuxK